MLTRGTRLDTGEILYQSEIQPSVNEGMSSPLCSFTSEPANSPQNGGFSDWQEPLRLC
jgi:hypothetical protein